MQPRNNSEGNDLAYTSKHDCSRKKNCNGNSVHPRRSHVRAVLNEVSTLRQKTLFSNQNFVSISHFSHTSYILSHLIPNLVNNVSGRVKYIIIMQFSTPSVTLSPSSPNILFSILYLNTFCSAVLNVRDKVSYAYKATLK